MQRLTRRMHGKRMSRTRSPPAATLRHPALWVRVASPQSRLWRRSRVSASPKSPSVSATGAMTGTTSPTHVPVQPNDPRRGQFVRPECTSRLAAQTVYCSCRCANASGRSDDGQTYCACPQGFACEPFVPPFAPQDANAGAYCIKSGTAWDPFAPCKPCDAQTQSCPPSSAPVAVGSTDGTRIYFHVALALGPGLCYPRPLPTDGTGNALCRMFVGLPAPDVCSSFAGLKGIDDVTAPALDPQGG